MVWHALSEVAHSKADVIQNCRAHVCLGLNFGHQSNVRIAPIADMASFATWLIPGRACVSEAKRGWGGFTLAQLALRIMEAVINIDHALPHLCPKWPRNEVLRVTYTATAIFQFSQQSAPALLIRHGWYGAKGINPGC